MLLYPGMETPGREIVVTFSFIDMGLDGSMSDTRARDLFPRINRPLDPYRDYRSAGQRMHAKPTTEMAMNR